MLSFFSSKPAKGPTATKPAPPADPPPDASGGGSEPSKETGLVLDALSSVLQLFAKYAFDTDVRDGDEVRRLSQAWKLHASMGAPRPDYPDDKPTAGVFYRDWKGLVRFFGEQRKDESTYVTRVLDDFRDLTWAFVGAAHQVMRDEYEESKSAAEQLSRMRAAVESNSTDLMKREALAVVGVIEQLSAKRARRQREQFAVLADKLKKLGRELEEAKRESGTDALTGLANRKSFDQYVTRCIELHSLLGQPAALMMVDVDRFKQVNDSYGHPAGDAVLKAVGSLLSRSFLRRVDFVARYGGDEFVVILQETGASNAALLAERLRKQTRELAPIETPASSEPLALTLSIGVSELRPSDDATTWIKRADTALYQAKRDGRDRVAAISEHDPSPPTEL